MLLDLGDIATAVLLRILEQGAELMVKESFPDHGHCRGGKMPVRRTGWSLRIRQVVVLMARAALDRLRAVAIGTATHLHGVAMGVIALAREVATRVAIHAAGMMKDGKDRLKGSD